MNSHELTVLELGTHRIRWDGKYNWVLSEVVIRERRKVGNIGEKYEGEENSCYYNTIEEAARHLLQDRVGNLGKHNSVSELIKAIQKCKDELESSIVSEIKRGYSEKNGA